MNHNHGMKEMKWEVGIKEAIGYLCSGEFMIIILLGSVDRIQNTHGPRQEGKVPWVREQSRQWELFKGSDLGSSQLLARAWDKMSNSGRSFFPQYSDKGCQFLTGKALSDLRAQEARNIDVYSSLGNKAKQCTSFGSDTILTWKRQ